MFPDKATSVRTPIAIYIWIDRLMCIHEKEKRQCGSVPLRRLQRELHNHHQPSWEREKTRENTRAIKKTIYRKKEAENWPLSLPSEVEEGQQPQSNARAT
jgi:hypothetical protein